MKVYTINTVIHVHTHKDKDNAYKLLVLCCIVLYCVIRLKQPVIDPIHLRDRS